MAIIDDFQTISNGDTIEDGWYNGAYNEVGIIPVGSVIPWLKSFTNVPQTLPDRWVECDGSVISDADSPMNGETLPDLNGDNRFLRGASTSGGTGGSETHYHSFTGSGMDHDYDSGGGKDIFPTGTNITHNTSSTSTLPTYYEVVWIMRIK